MRFHFLGYTFQPGKCRTKTGDSLLFQPVMSRKAKKNVMDKIREMRIHQKKVSLQEMAPRNQVRLVLRTPPVTSLRGAHIRVASSPITSLRGAHTHPEVERTSCAVAISTGFHFAITYGVSNLIRYRFT